VPEGRKALEGHEAPEGRQAPAEVVFYALSKKFVDDDQGRTLRPEIRQLRHYTLAIGHHIGVVDCLTPVLTIGEEAYGAWVAKLPRARPGRSWRGSSGGARSRSGGTSPSPWPPPWRLRRRPSPPPNSSGRRRSSGSAGPWRRSQPSTWW